MFCTIDHTVQGLPLKFCDEAEELLEASQDQPNDDPVTRLAALEFLSLGYLGQGRDHAVLKYLKEAICLGEGLGLWGVDDDRAKRWMDKLSRDKASSLLITTWGVFNWATMMSVFYHQPGLECPRQPPRLPIPVFSDSTATFNNPDPDPDPGTVHLPPLPQYMGGIFPHLCRFWSIMHEVALVYYSQDATLPNFMTAMRFSEYKFRELLAWSSNLPVDLLRNENNPHYVQILHIWFHAAVLDIFRPYVSQEAQLMGRRLRTFPASISRPQTIYGASVNQLKRLIIDYRLNYNSSTYTILWHTALIYLANAVLGENDADGWLFFFLLCVYGYERLRQSWRVTESITAGLLSMIMRKGNISGQMARGIMNDLRQKSLGHMPGKIRATFMVDLDLAMSDPESATAESLANNFEDNAMFGDLTNVFDGRQGGERV